MHHFAYIHATKMQHVKFFTFFRHEAAMCIDNHHVGVIVQECMSIDMRRVSDVCVKTTVHHSKKEVEPLKRLSISFCLCTSSNT